MFETIYVEVSIGLHFSFSVETNRGPESRGPWLPSLRSTALPGLRKLRCLPFGNRKNRIVRDCRPQYPRMSYRPADSFLRFPLGSIKNAILRTGDLNRGHIQPVELASIIRVGCHEVNPVNDIRMFRSISREKHRLRNARQ